MILMVVDEDDSGVMDECEKTTQMVSNFCLWLSFQDRPMVGLSEFLSPNHALPLFLIHYFHSFSEYCYCRLNVPHFVNCIIWVIVSHSFCSLFSLVCYVEGFDAHKV